MSQATIHFDRRGVRPQLPTPCFRVFDRAAFYREELLKHQRGLERQREYFSEQAIHGVECALRSILSRLDTLCRHQDCDQVLGALLKKLDLVTRASAWDESGRTH
jgi:hypothetical protein